MTAAALLAPGRCPFITRETSQMSGHLPRLRLLQPRKRMMVEENGWAARYYPEESAAAVW